MSPKIDYINSCLSYNNSNITFPSIIQYQDPIHMSLDWNILIIPSSHTKYCEIIPDNLFTSKQTMLINSIL